MLYTKREYTRNWGLRGHVVKGVMLVLCICVLVGSSFSAGLMFVYDKNWQVRYYLTDGLLYDRDWLLRYYVKDDRVYDKNWQLQYYLKDERLYDKDWQLQYYLRDRETPPP